jgi:sulfite reductase (NADPH) hemoprotein beta-component
MDAKRISRDLTDFTQMQNRFSKLERENKSRSDMLKERFQTSVVSDHKKKYRESMNDEDLLEWLKKHYGESIDASGRAMVL